MGMGKALRTGALALAAVIWAASAAADGDLTIRDGARTVTLARADLLARPDVARVTVPRDIGYRARMEFRAVPLAALLEGFAFGADEVVEVVATDGYAAAIPRDLVFAGGAGASTAWLASEPPGEGWPSLPGKDVSAGPYYVVWLDPKASGIRSEQWPYMVAEIRAAPAPAARWPEIGVDAALAVDDPARAGLRLFVTQCMACHTMNGAGSAEMGPDLNLPMNPVEYFRADVLPRYLRNPASVRAWPDQKMAGFEPDQLSDHEIDQVIAYLAHMKDRKAR